LPVVVVVRNANQVRVPQNQSHGQQVPRNSALQRTGGARPRVCWKIRWQCHAAPSVPPPAPFRELGQGGSWVGVVLPATDAACQPCLLPSRVRSSWSTCRRVHIPNVEKWRQDPTNVEPPPERTCARRLERSGRLHANRRACSPARKGKATLA